MRPIIRTTRDTIKQYYNQKNSASIVYSRVQTRVPDAFVGEFINEEKGYVLDSTILYNDGITAATSRVEKRLSLLGCTTEAQALKYLRLQKNLSRNISELYKFTTGIEGLASLRGDRVALNHEQINKAHFTCRVRDKLFNSSNQLVGLQLDQERVPDLESGKTYGIRVLKEGNTFIDISVLRFEKSRVQKDDNNLTDLENTPIATRGGEVLQARAEEYQTVMFTNPISKAEADNINEDDYITFGETDKKFVNCLVQSIKLNRDLSVSLNLIPYIPEVFNLSA